MNKEGKIDTVTKLLENCNELKSILFQKAIFNLNDCTGMPNFIESDSSDWKIFKNKVLKLDQLIGPYSVIEKIKKIVTTDNIIDDTILDNIIVELEELKMDIEIEANSNIPIKTTESTLEGLLHEMDDLESEFKLTPKVSGIPSVKTIHNNPKFLLWRSKITNELDGNTNLLAQKILQELEYFNRWNDESLFNNIKANLTVLVQEHSKENTTLMNKHDSNSLNDQQSHKLFISHSSEDKEYVEAFVEMLICIGMSPDSFICTSVSGYGIPGGDDIFNWLREQFLNYKNLRVLFALSHNYYSSAACLNEMGAAWITKATYTLLLLPEFSYKDIKGCVNPRQIGISFELNDDELKHRLNEFKELLVSEHNLHNIPQISWDKYRDKFINSVHEIFAKKLAKSEKTKS